MPTYNKIHQPVYTSILGHSALSDGTIQVEYVVGVGTDQDGQMTDFRVLTTQWISIEPADATQLSNAPLTKEDIGKTPNEIMLDRIYNHLKETGVIIV